MPTNGKQRLTARAFLEIKVPNAPHISPDGRRVIFAVAEADFEESRWVSHLWLADLPDGNARQVTFSYEGERVPRWSPDGRWIAFLSARPDMTEPPPEEENEEDLHKEQIWFLPAAGGEAQRLTNTKEGVRNFDWLPDSSGIIFLAPEARPQPTQHARDDARKRKIDPVVEQEDRLRQQFWRVGIEDRKPDLLYTGDFGVLEFSVSPDGARLVFNSNTTGDPNDYYRYNLFVLDIEAEEVRKLLERPGGKFQPQWSPDGTQISFIANLDPALSFSQECVWTVSAEGGEPANRFADVPYDVEDTLWGPRTPEMCAIAADRTNGPLFRVDEGGVSPLTEPGENIVCLDFDALTVEAEDTAARHIVVVAEDASTPPELYLLEPGGARRALTEINKPFTENYALPRQEVIRWQSDGLEIEGLLLTPEPEASAEPGALPLVVQVHGGPKGRVVNTLRSYYLHPVWASEGYLVLKPNFRGSEGYGNAFAVANRRDLGGGDFRDIMSGVDLLIERGLADPKRIGIMGGSYGGYMTNWAIGQTDRFAAAISMFGIFNLVTDYSNSEISRWDPDYMGAYYWEDPEIYRQCSPATNLQRINTPVLIIHGESDTNTFIANSREMYRALKDLGKTVQFVHYPREGHGLREPNHRLDEMRRCLAWFDRYLKGAGEAQPVYRIGDRIEHAGYEYMVLSAQDAPYAGQGDDEGDRLLEVAFSLASREPVQEALSLELDHIRLTDAAGVEYYPAGVPVQAGGILMMVIGDHLSTDVEPDPDTGRLALALALAYQVPRAGGVFTFHVTTFPPVEIVLGPKEEEKEEHREGEEPESPHKPESEPPSTPPAEEGPAPTPQRPQP